MSKIGDPKTPKKPAVSREDRLKAALKANMARRKQQARARSDSDAEASVTATEIEQKD